MPNLTLADLIKIDERHDHSTKEGRYAAYRDVEAAIAMKEYDIKNRTFIPCRCHNDTSKQYCVDKNVCSKIVAQTV